MAKRWAFCRAVGLTALLGAMPVASQRAWADDDIVAKIAAAKGEFDDADFVVVFDATDVTVADSGIGTSEMTRVVKILKDAGVRKQSIRRWGFDPATNTLELKSVRVHRKDGTIETVDVGTAVTQPESAGIIFWGNQQISMCIPNLDIGDTVETTHVKTGFNTAYLASPEEATGRSLQPPMPGHWYEVVDWQESVPVLEKRFRVRIARDKPLQYEVVNGALSSSVRFEGETAIYTFEKKDIPPFKREPKMVSRDDVACKLVLATLNDWHAKARWFHAANEPSFETDDAIRTKVAELVEGVEDEDEKVAILNHWVAENVRYVGTTRGAHEGYTTHAVTETFHDRGGVCKDKAGLLVAMLREAGFDSYIVMTRAGARVEQTPADQFNHAVTSIRRGDGSFRLLDPTWLPKNREMWSSAEQLQAVVYGTPDGESGLQLSPYSPPEANATTWETRSTIGNNGDLQGAMIATMVGCPETSLRKAMARYRPEDRLGRFEQSIRQLSSTAIIESLDVTDPVDFSGPAGIRMEFMAPGYAFGDSGKRYFRLPSLTGVLADMVLSDLRGSAEKKAKKRRTPVRLRSTRRLVCSETITLPTGWTAVRLPEKCSIEGPAGSIEFEIDSGGGEIHYQCAVDIKKRIVPVEDYESFKRVIDALSDLEDALVVCRLEDRSASR